MAIAHGLDGISGRGLLFIHGGLPMIGTGDIGMNDITLNEIESIDIYGILMN